MAKFICKVCDSILELDRHTLKVIDDEIASPEAVCCDTYMKSIRSNKGFGGIIKRENGSVGGKF
jgi:hypothetical protein